MTQENFYPDLPPVQREELLRDHASRIEKRGYAKRLTEQEKTELKDSVLEDVSEIDRLKEELADHNKKVKAEIKELNISRKRATAEVKSGVRMMHGEVFEIANFVDETISEYNILGELVGSRKMKPSERQTTIKSLNTGTND